VTVTYDMERYASTRYSPADEGRGQPSCWAVHPRGTVFANVDGVFQVQQVPW